MLDKLETELQPLAAWRGHVSSVVDAVRLGQDVPGVSFDRNYARSIDLRPTCGIPALLQFGQRQKGTHKLVIFDCGTRSLSDIFAIREQVADGDPLADRVMRADLAADLERVTPAWVRANVRACFKRFMAEYGRLEMEFSEMGHRKIQTCNFGKRPAFLRCYDKSAEWMGQWIRETKVKKLATPAGMAAALGLDGLLSITAVVGVVAGSEDVESFADWLRRKYQREVPSGPLTRFERQIPASRMPEQLKRTTERGELVDVSTLLARLPITDKENPRYFDPFESLEFSGGSPQPPKVGDWSHLARPVHSRPKLWSAKDYFKGMGIRGEVESVGYQRTYALANSDRNGSRQLSRYRAFLPCGEAGESMTREDLERSYRDSLRGQGFGTA